MMLLFSPCTRCPCPCSDAVLRSCEEALAEIILHRPPSLGVGSFRLSGTAGSRGRPGRRAGDREGGGGPGPESMYEWGDFTMFEALSPKIRVSVLTSWNWNHSPYTQSTYDQYASRLGRDGQYSAEVAPAHKFDRWSLLLVLFSVSAISTDVCV